MEKYVIIWHVFNLRYKCGYMVRWGDSMYLEGGIKQANAGLLWVVPPKETTATSYRGAGEVDFRYTN